MEVSKSNYFYLTDNEVHMGSQKQQSAFIFLKGLNDRIKDGSYITLPENHTLREITTKVLRGYEAKQGIFQRIWECFLRIIVYFSKSCEIYLTNTQRIHHYAGKIANTDSSKVAILMLPCTFGCI
jgi:hypothetical protein